MDSPRKILVTYASRAGSTTEIARVISQTLTAHSAAVDLLPMQEVMSVTQYQMVVMGSAIHREQWLPEARQFIEQYHHDLTLRPVAAFLVCMALAKDNPKARQSAAAWMQPVRDALHPVSEGYFAGVLNLRKIPLGYRLLFRLVTTFTSWSEGDYRDWDAIRRWTNELPLASHL